MAGINALTPFSHVDDTAADVDQNASRRKTGTGESQPVKTSTLLDNKALKEMYEYGCIAKAAYCGDEKQALTNLQQWCGDLAKSIGGTIKLITDNKPLLGRMVDTDTEVYVILRDNGELIFAFRGTENKADAITDIVFHPTPIKWLAGMRDLKPSGAIKVHDGFLTSFNDVANQESGELDLQHVAMCMAKLRNITITKVTCCGHSLGGALATLAAYWCAKVAFKELPLMCVTFGSPRVGNQAFADDFKKCVKTAYRFQHRDDIVPTVPPFWMGFIHVGTSITLCQPKKDGFGYFRSTQNKALVKDISAEEYVAVVGDRPLGKAYMSVEDHFMIPGYLKAITSVLHIPLPKEDAASQLVEAQASMNLLASVPQTDTAQLDQGAISDAADSLHVAGGEVVVNTDGKKLEQDAVISAAASSNLDQQPQTASAVGAPPAAVADASTAKPATREIEPDRLGAAKAPSSKGWLGMVSDSIYRIMNLRVTIPVIPTAVLILAVVVVNTTVLQS